MVSKTVARRCNSSHLRHVNASERMLNTGIFCRKNVKWYMQRRSPDFPRRGPSPHIIPRARAHSPSHSVRPHAHIMRGFALFSPVFCGFPSVTTSDCLTPELFPRAPGHTIPSRRNKSHACQCLGIFVLLTSLPCFPLPHHASPCYSRAHIRLRTE